MKSLDRFQFLANVLIVACARPNAEVGKLVKALVTYATEGTRTDLGDLRLEAYFDLIAQDLDSQRMAAEQKSRKRSESWLRSRKVANAARVQSVELQGIIVPLIVLQRKPILRAQRT